ncbi:MAG: hypothetical protein ACREMH_03040 [Gemmatimonadales bacterium]
MRSSLRTLLAGLIDYAGLFPPAGLPMEQAVANYASYLRGEDRWALGRFIVPAGRLGEFSEAASGVLPAAGEPWRLSALVGSNAGGEVEAARRFNARRAPAGGALVDTLEGKADRAEGVKALSAAAAPEFTLFVEIPVDNDPLPLVAAIVSAGARAKIRTGGVTVDAFPPSGAVVRFLVACVRQPVAFKATAGLHHPIRGDYPLTYALDAHRGTMYGYLNLLLAAALLQSGGGIAQVENLLEETRLESFAFEEDGVAWRDTRIPNDVLARIRGLALGIGSCSFDEPLDDLRRAGLH